MRSAPAPPPPAHTAILSDMLVHCGCDTRCLCVTREHRIGPYITRCALARGHCSDTSRQCQFCCCRINSSPQSSLWSQGRPAQRSAGENTIICSIQQLSKQSYYRPASKYLVYDSIYYIPRFYQVLMLYLQQSRNKSVFFCFRQLRTINEQQSNDGTYWGSMYG